MEHLVLPVLANDGQSRATHEVLEVEPLSQGRYRLLHSPALLEGVAAGDVIEPNPAILSGFIVISRSGNLAIVVAFSSADMKTITVARFTELVSQLGGVYDGGPERIVVASIPISTGFPRIEQALTLFAGGKRGHSNMDHWMTTEEIKTASRQRRRLDSKKLIAKELEALQGKRRPKR